MAKVPNDYELNFLKKCTKEELEPLVRIILGSDQDKNIDKSGRISSELDITPAFNKHFPDHTKYVDEIIEEIQRYGGNSIRNLMRGFGVSYHEELCDVAEKMKVNFNKSRHTDVIEEQLMAKVLEDIWEKMAEEDRQKFIDEVGVKFGMGKGGFAAGVAIAIFRAGGIKSYYLALTIVNSIAKLLLGHGLRLVENAMLVRVLSWFAGPLGWILTGLWIGVDFAGPAYRVTVPACIYIAALRKMKTTEKDLTDAQKKEVGL